MQQQPEIADRQRTPVGIAVLEEKRKVRSRKQQQHCVKHHGCEPLTDDHFDVADRRSRQKLDCPGALLFGEQAHADHGNEKQTDDADVREQRTNYIFVYAHGKALAAHLRFQAHHVEISNRVPEEKPEDDREHGQQQVSDGRRKVAVEFFPADNPDISHCCSPCEA